MSVFCIFLVTSDPVILSGKTSHSFIYCRLVFGKCLFCVFAQTLPILTGFIRISFSPVSKGMSWDSTLIRCLWLLSLKYTPSLKWLSPYPVCRLGHILVPCLWGRPMFRFWSGELPSFVVFLSYKQMPRQAVKSSLSCSIFFKISPPPLILLLIALCTYGSCSCMFTVMSL